MQFDANVETLIKACVEAGLAARRARDLVIAMRREAMVRGTKLSHDAAAELEALDVEAKRLSRAFDAAQISLNAASPARFEELQREVKERVKARLDQP
jgi:hypothetical protein